MKKLLIMSLVLSTGIILSACGDAAKEEQIKGEMIQKNASAKLDEIIKDKKNTEVNTEESAPEGVEEVTNPPIIESEIAPTDEEPVSTSSEEKREA